MRPCFIYLLKFIPFECSFVARCMTSRDVVRSDFNTFSQLRRPSGCGFFHALRQISGDKLVGMYLSVEYVVFLFSSCSFVPSFQHDSSRFFLGVQEGFHRCFIGNREWKRGPLHDPCLSRK